VTAGAPGPVFDLEMDSLDVVFGGVMDRSWNSSLNGPGDNDESSFVWNVGQVLTGTLC
jgi:hypothetical protein